jgi:hypothetical protein
VKDAVIFDGNYRKACANEIVRLRMGAMAQAFLTRPEIEDLASAITSSAAKPLRKERW